MTDVAAPLTGSGTTSTSSPDASERAEPVTIGVAEEPAVVTGIHVPSAGWSTLPSGRVHDPSTASVVSTPSNSERMSSASDSSTTVGSASVSFASCVQPARTPTAAAVTPPTAVALKSDRRVILSLGNLTGSTVLIASAPGPLPR